jgi:hypothetical protein
MEERPQDEQAPEDAEESAPEEAAADQAEG